MTCIVGRFAINAVAPAGVTFVRRVGGAVPMREHRRAARSADAASPFAALGRLIQG